MSAKPHRSIRRTLEACNPGSDLEDTEGGDAEGIEDNGSEDIEGGEAGDHNCSDAENPAIC